MNCTEKKICFASGHFVTISMGTEVLITFYSVLICESIFCVLGKAFSVDQYFLEDAIEFTR